MKSTDAQKGSKPLEVRTVQLGFVLVAIVIGLTAVSYVLNMEFRYQWLVWVIGVAFMAVALLSLEWIRAYRRPPGEAPKGGLRLFLLIAMPLAFVLDSQICGLGFKACTFICHALSYLLIVLAIVMAIQLHRGKSIGPFLIPVVILSLVPHCVCHAPINVIWHSIFGGYAPTCFVMPLAVVLFSVTALRGLRTRFSAALVILMLVVIAFVAVGNSLWGFPWPGCIQ